MAARLPIVTTPAGEASRVVQDGVTGYVVPFDDVQRMADCMVRLAESPALRRQMGEAGRELVEQHSGADDLAARLLFIYQSIALQQNRPDIYRILIEQGRRAGSDHQFLSVNGRELT